MSQLSLFQPAAAEPLGRRQPDLGYIRKSLRARLWLMRTAETLPWSEGETASHEVHFPELARLLPSEEAEALIADFHAELLRLR